jgi:mono/diheme cytochrome c family protein
MKKTIILSLAVVAAASALTGCRGWESDKPPVHLNWNMDTQEKGKAYRAYDFFSDKRMMRQPVEGTVARGYLHDDDHLYRGLGSDGKPVEEFPQGMNPENLVARGANRYGIYCAPCHGKDADGQGPVAQRGGLLVPPPSFKQDRLKEMVNGQIYAAMLNGVNNGNMPSYAVQIPAEDRWAIIAYLRTVQGTDFVVKAGAPVVLTAGPSAENGKALYKSKGCNACHSLDGTKIVGPTFKGLAGRTEATSAGDVVVDEAYLVESIQNPTAKVVNGFPPAMPVIAMTPDEMKSLVLFIESLK